eukprot:CAMPEP_0181425446 /NCGR_PEP_ID=MMETSP1110-20121109/15161_1 /TAXON_ID=174948 /ORGANISM="Symbiodinium sp., Strain CCMP421" /LENGTH=825 /DNA_ID=CAMNT_0023548629 /DNA_START=260 /DNA_END=2738 /DNA_ORIENTATION=+
MQAALIAALLLPELSKLLDLTSNVWTDLAMSIGMALFILELIALSVTDAHYLLSFFHFMDMIGTASMIFDISFLLGLKGSEPRMSDRDSAESRVLLLRASRAARVGARAGRLTRVLRVCRCFLDFGDIDEPAKRPPTKKAGFDSLREEDQPAGKKSIAKVISVRLSNLLATRVASLTIFLVMVMPLFDVMSFPQKDLALDAWVDQVSHVNQMDEKLTISELQKMAEFFSHHSYGPYNACSGKLVEAEEFHCEKYYQGEDWGRINVEPDRSASALLVHTKTFLVSFDMTRPVKVKAAIALLSNLFTVVVMLFFGVALSAVVTDLAVTPLERMLGTVREIAATVFKFSSLMVGQEDDEGQPEETTEIDNAGEMILLEKVVEKLAAIASVQAKTEQVPDTEDMDEENLGVLKMLGGGGVRPSHFSSEGSCASDKGKTRGIYVRPTPLLNFETNGVDEDTFNSLGFNVFDLTADQLNKLAFHIIISHSSGAVICHDGFDEALIQNFVSAVQKGYPDNPFHNFGHAVDVQAGIVKTMKLMEAETFLSNLEQFSLLVAGLGHDIGHPGLNNAFLSEVGHELAIKYNDRSPLENMHCANLYQLLGKPETKLFASLSPEDYKEVRRICVEVILHTDMMCHQSMVKDLNLLYQMNSEVLRPGLSTRATVRKSTGKRKTTVDGIISEPSQVFGAPENKMLVMETILHSADVSNPAREWAVTKDWADKCLIEFFAQGDQEKERGIPVQFLNDRDKLNRPNSQIGFIEFMIAPFFAAQIWLWPLLFEYGDCLSANIGMWEELWEEETSPSEEDLDKVRSRVAQVQEMLSCAAMRIAS